MAQTDDFEVMCLESRVNLVEISRTLCKEATQALETGISVERLSSENKRTGVLCQELDSI